MAIIQFQIHLAIFYSVILTKPLTNNSSNKWQKNDAVCDYLYEDCDDGDHEFNNTTDGNKKKSKKEKLLLEKDTRDLEIKYKQNSSMDSLEMFNYYDRMFADMQEHTDYEIDDTINGSKEKSKELLLEKEIQDLDNKDKQNNSMNSLEMFNYYYDGMFTDMHEYSDYEFDDISYESKEDSKKEKVLIEKDTTDLDSKEKHNSSMDDLDDFSYNDRKFTHMHEYHVHTKTKLGYSMFFPVIQDSVQFKVRTTHDAFLWLSEHPERDYETFCEVYLGGYNNLKSGIRRHKKDDVVVETPNILSEHEFRGFWVRWVGGDVSIGREGHRKPFLSWKDPDPFPVAYVGFESRDGATAAWKIRGVSAAVTKSTMIWWWEGEPKTQSLPPEIEDCQDDARCRYPFSTKKTTKH